MRKLTKFTVVLLALLMVGGMFQPAIHAFSEVKIMSKDIMEYEKANIEIFNQNDESLGTLKYEIKGKPIQLPFLKNIEILRIRAEEKTPELLSVKIMVKIQNKIDEGIIKVAIMLWGTSVNEDITKETKVVFTKWDSNTSNENTGNNYNSIGDDNKQTEETKQKDIPLTPLTPSEPIEPEQNDIPLTPLTPSEPVEPEQKDIPLTPLTPSEPVEPEQPDTPLTPLTPSEPVETDKPDTPLIPLTPSEPVEPEQPLEPQDPGKEEPQPQEPGKEEPQPQELTDELLKEIIDKVSELLSENKEESIDGYINSLKLSEEDKDKVNNLINELKEKLNKPKEEPQDPGKKEPQPEEPQDPGKEDPQEPGDDKQQPEEPQEPGKEEPQEPGTENPGKEEPQPEEPQEPGTEEPGKEEPGKEEPQEPGKEEPGKEEPQPEEPKDPEEKIVDDPSWDLGKRFNNGAIINKEEFRNEFLRLVNEKRAEVGVAPLKLGKHLEKGSDIRAKEMADHGSMRGGYPTEEDPENKKGKHMRPDGKESFRTAYDYLGNYDSYKGGNLGENILERYRVYPDEDVRREWIGTSKSLAKKCFDLWAASPGHLRNMVGSQYKTTWISVATDEVEDYKLFMIAQNVFDVEENDDPLN